jgi:hypothetical protein
LAAAIRLFGSLGYERTRMGEIAAGAGISSASLYRNFGSRKDLFEEALREVINRSFDPGKFVLFIKGWGTLSVARCEMRTEVGPPIHRVV